MSAFRLLQTTVEAFPEMSRLFVLKPRTEQPLRKPKQQYKKKHDAVNQKPPL